MNNKQAIKVLESLDFGVGEGLENHEQARIIKIANNRAISALKLEGVIIAILFTITALICFGIILCIADKVY